MQGGRGAGFFCFVKASAGSRNPVVFYSHPPQFQFIWSVEQDPFLYGMRAAKTHLLARRIIFLPVGASAWKIGGVRCINHIGTISWQVEVLQNTHALFVFVKNGLKAMFGSMARMMRMQGMHGKACKADRVGTACIKGRKEFL
jgi:hypothetical protein